MKPFRALFISLLVFSVLGLSAEGASVIYSRGNVRVKHQGQKWWSLLRKGDEVKPGEEAKLLINAACEIDLDDRNENVIRVNGPAEFTITSTDPADVNLLQGQILAKVKKGSDFKITTPVAVCGARGTGYEVDTDGKTATVLVFDDAVYILPAYGYKGPKEEIVIESGKKATFSKYRRLGKVRYKALTRLETSRWNRWIEELEERLEEKGRMDRIRELQDRLNQRYE